MKSVYQYTAINLLKGQPYHYNFSAIEGADFLNHYRVERISHLDNICQFLDGNSIDKNDKGLIDALIALRRGEQIKKYKITNTPFSANGFCTLDLLKSSSELILINGSLDQLGLLDSIRELMRKFEVSKRLRKSYDKNWRMATEASASLTAYSLLAFLVSVIITDFNDIRSLNTLLKLNDLVISAMQYNTNLLIFAALAVAIKKEIEIIDDLLRKKIG